MAYSPEKKAEVCADLLSGMSCARAAAKHGVGKATVVAWYQELKEEGFVGDSAKKKPTNQNRPKTDQPDNSDQNRTDQPDPVGNRGEEILPGSPRVLSRKERFWMAFEELLLASIQMDVAQARTLADADFIKAKPEGVNVLSESLRKRVDTLVSALGRGDETGEQPNQHP